MSNMKQLPKKTILASLDTTLSWIHRRSATWPQRNLSCHYGRVPTLRSMFVISSSLVIHLQTSWEVISPSYSLIHHILTWI